MEKLTKSMPLFKERNCSVSIVLDSRTRRKNACEFPLSLRFTIDRKFFYLTVGSSFTEKRFSDICNATKCKSENYKLQKEWKDTLVPKYKEVLMNLNRGGILTFEMVRPASTTPRPKRISISNCSSSVLPKVLTPCLLSAIPNQVVTRHTPASRPRHSLN